MHAKRRSGSKSRPNSSSMTSKVVFSPLSDQNDPLQSKGVAFASPATPATSAGGTNKKAALGSMNRRMSQGQATRTTFGLARVTQIVRPTSSRGGIFDAPTSG